MNGMFYDKIGKKFDNKNVLMGIEFFLESRELSQNISSFADCMKFDRKMSYARAAETFKVLVYYHFIVHCDTKRGSRLYRANFNNPAMQYFKIIFDDEIRKNFKRMK